MSNWTSSKLASIFCWYESRLPIVCFGNVVAIKKEWIEMFQYSKWRWFSTASSRSFAMNSILIGLLVVSLTFVSYSRNVSVSHTQMSVHAVSMLSYDDNSAPGSDEDLTSLCYQHNTCSSPALIGSEMTLPIALGADLFVVLSFNSTRWLSSPPFHPPKAWFSNPGFRVGLLTSPQRHQICRCSVV